MNETLATLVHFISAALCGGMGGLVLYHNPHRKDHVAFSVLSFNLALWALGVGFILECTTESSALFFIRATFIVAAFLPVHFHYFTGVCGRQTYQAPRGMLWLLYACGFIMAAGSFTPWYIESVKVFGNTRPVVEYGPIFTFYGVTVVLTMLISYPMLYGKWRDSSGVQRRQIEHVILGIFMFTTAATLTNVVGPLVNFGSAEAYGPVFIVLMMATFGYAMVRYHLLDVWVIASRTTIYVVTTALITLTFFGTISGVHWSLRASGYVKDTIATVLAAAIIAIILLPIRERLQKIMDLVVLKKGYDGQRLLSRVNRFATQSLQQEQLLEDVCEDIARTVGVQYVEVLLIDKDEKDALVTAYAHQNGRLPRHESEFSPLLEHFQHNKETLVLEMLIHGRPSPERMRLAGQLAELNAYLCAPLQTTTGLLGLLILGHKETRDIYTAAEAELFSALAATLAAAIENTRLYRQLEEANLHRALILSQMRGGVVAVDTAGRVTTVNEGARSLLGPMEVGNPLSSLMSPVGEILQQTLETMRPITDYETIIAHEDGREFPVVLSSATLSSADNESKGAMVMIYDLTHVKRLEQNVQRAHRLSSVGTLAAGMAHEIKNPLVSIKTFAQLLVSRYEDDDFRTTFTEIIPQEVDRIDSIVSRLLDFARPKPSSFAAHDVRRIIEGVLVLVANQLRKCRVETVKDWPEGPLEVFCDEQQLHQVFLNMTLNALDAMDETGGGTLKISLERQLRHTRRQGASPWTEVESVRIAFADTGHGIPPESLDRIFTPFYTTKETGTGLGLSVVHGIITEHGGEIDVLSTAGKGATFVITLPAARVQQQVRTALK